MKQNNKKILQKLIINYTITLIIVFSPILIIGGEIVEEFVYKYIFLILLCVLVSFLINYLILRKTDKKIDVDDITNIIISEVFNEDNLNIEYDTRIKNMLKKLKEEKELSIYSMEKYKESEKIRTEFTANVTHELKTPLTSIIGYAELLEMGVGDEDDVKKFAKTIGEDSRKLLLIIDDIITLSRYDDPTLVKVEFEYFNIGEFVRDLVNNIENVASTKNIRIYKDIEDVYVYADKSKIRDLVNNLISNSIKYNKENGIVGIKLYSKNRNCIIEIEDTGIGISESDKNRIFERFFVVDKARGKKSGTGLGLAIVKHVALIHNGKIELESKMGIGSKFTFEFPIENFK
ncbi:sensor histidine kinase [Miniphocaeibacter massiliensis]|uniref:sensor histidine kinase n=1 Tax=Miniphocaeibacter massiliensis TaxID=2041841 RepID=UPI000C1C4912|nr:HAMP domain-containing sensor histidine kinase [Miniphocaeibacter massiliensis]